MIAINLIEAWDRPGVAQIYWGEPQLGRREHPRACIMSVHGCEVLNFK
jgi:hypothetical protein